MIQFDSSYVFKDNRKLGSMLIYNYLCQKRQFRLLMRESESWDALVESTLASLCRIRSIGYARNAASNSFI